MANVQAQSVKAPRIMSDRYPPNMSTPKRLSCNVPWLGEVSVSEGGILITLLAGYVMPGTPSWSFIFYLASIPPLLLTLRRGWRPDLRHPPLAAMLCLWLWSTLAIAWTHDLTGHGKSHVFWYVNALWTLVFMLNFVSALNDQPQSRRRVIAMLIYGAAVNASICLVLFALKGDLTTRLFGWGITSNPVMGAAIMDIALLLAFVQVKAAPRQRLAIVLAALPIIAFILLSYSRTAWIALAVALLLAGLGRYPVRAALAGLALAGAALALWKFGAVLFPVLWNNLASRGSDCHMQLWRTAWQFDLKHPLAGYGPAATLPKADLPGPFCPPYPAPHDLYLSIMLYSGGIGLGLFMITVALLWWHLYAATQGFTRRLWLAVGLIPLIVGISDLIQIIKGPSPMWYIFWVPMLLIVTLPRNRPERPGGPAL